MPKLICGVDDSESARCAVSVTVGLAAALGRDAVLLHAVPPPIPAAAVSGWYAYPRHLDLETVVSVGEEPLTRLAAEFELPPETQRRVEVGPPAAVLAEAADDESVELLAVGTRGRGWLATAFLGSVSAAVVSQAPCPVLVVPPEASLHLGPVVCAVDDSAAARRAVVVARRLSDALTVDLVLAHVAATRPLSSSVTGPTAGTQLARGEQLRAEELLADLAFDYGLGTDVERRVAFGIEADAIAEVADEAGAGVIVIGTRRRGALKALLAGSVSFELRTAGPRPVIVVPDDARVPSRF
jgi:nucleotide-binding universal stress UspA family protein